MCSESLACTSYALLRKVSNCEKTHTGPLKPVGTPPAFLSPLSERPPSRWPQALAPAGGTPNTCLETDSRVTCRDVSMTRSGPALDTHGPDLERVTTPRSQQTPLLGQQPRSARPAPTTVLPAVPQPSHPPRLLRTVAIPTLLARPASAQSTGFTAHLLCAGTRTGSFRVDAAPGTQGRQARSPWSRDVARGLTRVAWDPRAGPGPPSQGVLPGSLRRFTALILLSSNKQQSFLFERKF